MLGTNLEEATDVDFVVCVHEDNVLKQPEERPEVIFFGLQQLKDAIVLKEQPAGALYRQKRELQQEETCQSVSASRK